MNDFWKFLKGTLYVCVYILPMIAGLIMIVSGNGSSSNDYTPSQQQKSDGLYQTSTPVPSYNYTPSQSVGNVEPCYTTSSREKTPDDAYSEGYDDGYAQGKEDGRNGCSHGYGYDDGTSYYDYYATKYKEGYEVGYDDGYSNGQSEYEEEE